MAKPAEPRVAVVGCGAWGRNHVRTFNALGALAAVSDADAETARAAAETAGVEALEFGAVLKDAAIDAMVIATPDALHADMARRALVAGKHVLVEKPMAMSAADAAQLVETAKAETRVLMTGHILRFHAAFHGLLSALPDIGTLRHITARRMHMAGGPPRHALWDLGPHDLSMILAVTGELPSRVSAVTQCETAPGRPQAGHIALEFESGLGADIAFSNIHPVKLHQLCIAGDDGHLVFEDSKPWPEKLTRFSPGLAQAGKPVKAQPISLTPGEPLAEEARAFLAAIGGTPLPAADADEAVAVIRVLTAAERAARSGGAERP